MDSATKTPQDARATDKVLQALSTLAALIDRSIKEVNALDLDFQERLLQAVHETETSLQNQAAQHLETALAETRARLEEQFKARMAEMSVEWEAERTRLNSDMDRVTKASTQFEAERARLNAELGRLSAEQAAAKAEAEKAIAAASAAAASTAKAGPSVNMEFLIKEIERTEGLVKEISALIENPATELSTVIRKNVERAELESYLKGIRFALNGSSGK